MDSVKLNDRLQVVGLFALVGSLVFVGLQLRQEQEIALSAAYQTRADQSIALTLTSLESDTTLSFWAKTYGIVEEELTPLEVAFGRSFASAQLVYWENMHYQYQNGFVSEEHWQTEVEVMKQLMLIPIFSDTYESAKAFWRASFRQVLEQVLEDQDRYGAVRPFLAELGLSSAFRERRLPGILKVVSRISRSRRSEANRYRLLSAQSSHRESCWDEARFTMP